MAKLLKIGGALWALIGLGNIIAFFMQSSDAAIRLFGTIALEHNTFYYLFPGLVLYGVGRMMAPKSRDPASPSQ